MIAVKIGLLTAVLIVVAKVDHGAANELCVEYILAGEPLFKRGAENTYMNFFYAFKHLSIEVIFNRFKFMLGDSDDIITQKIKQKDYLLGYFKDLLKAKSLRHSPFLSPELMEASSVKIDGNKHNFSQMDYPTEWCIRQVHIVFGNSGNNYYLNKCAEFTVGYLLQNAPNLNAQRIFTILYMDWTEEKILNAIIDQRNTNLSLAINMTALFIEHFSLGYYNHFLDYIENRNSDGRFKSIEMFCESQD